MSYGSNHVLTSTQVGRTDDSNVGHKKSRQLPCVINATASHRKNVVFAAHHRKHLGHKDKNVDFPLMLFGLTD